MMNNFVFSGRDGVIEFGPFLPNGRLPIAQAQTSDQAALLREIVESISRHAYDGETLLVPGIPEADTDDQALDALIEFRRRVTDRLAFADAPGEHRDYKAAAHVLEADGFRLGSDAARRDLWRHVDGRTARIHWRSIAGDELGRFWIERFDTETAAIAVAAETLEKRLAELYAARVQTAGHGRRARIQEQINVAEEELEALRLSSRARAGLEPGQILYSSWGYDQTNVAFFRVEKVKGAWLTLQKLEAAEESDGPGTMTGKVVPADPPKPIGATFRRKLHSSNAGGDPFVMIRSYEYAHAWDGTAKRVSHYG